MKRRVLLLVLAGALASVVGSAQVRADNPIGYPFTVTLRCDNKQSYQAVLLPGDALQLVGSSSNFRVAVWSYIDASGQLQYLVNSNSAPPKAEILTCHYTGPVSGFDYTVVGFFTPVGP